MKNFVLLGPLPVGTRACDFKYYQVEEILFESLEAVCEYINNRGGLFALYVGETR